MSFTFPGDISLHGTSSSYASKDHLRTTSQLHQAQNIAAHHCDLVIGLPSSDHDLLSWPVILLVSVGSRQGETLAGLGYTGMIQQLPMNAAEAAPLSP